MTDAPATSWRSSVLALVAHAAVVAGAMFFGYATGIALVLFRFVRVENLHRAILDGFSGADQRDPLRLALEPYRNGFRVDRFPPYVVLDEGSWLSLAVTLSAVSAVALAVVRRAPLRLAPGRLTDSPADARAEVVAFWRSSLRHASSGVPSGWVLSTSLLIGLIGAVLTEVYSIARLEIGYCGGTLALSRPSRPVLGPAAMEDAVWLLAWAVALPAFAALLGARRLLRQDPSFVARWCLHCGYPRPSAGSESPLAAGEVGVGLGPCSECGTVANLSPSFCRANSLFAGLGIITLFAVVLLAHTYVTHVPRAVRWAMNASVTEFDAATIRSGPAYLVDRPDGRIWLRVENGQLGQGVELVLTSASDEGTPRTVQRVTLKEGTRATATIRHRQGGTINISADWQEAIGIAHVYFAPSGATSIRAIDSTEFPQSE